jgi:uncharacterized membrane protein
MKSMKSFHERVSRSIIKAITFRLLILTADAIVVYALTRRVDLTVGLVIVSNFYHTIIYFFHERIWNNVKWGKHARIAKGKSGKIV